MDELIVQVIGTIVLLCFLLLIAVVPLSLVALLVMLLRDIWKTRER